MTSYSNLVAKQRAFFRSGATLSLGSRRKTLETLKTLLTKHRDEIAEASFKDIHRSKEQNFELPMALAHVDELLANLDKWAAPTQLPTSAPHTPGEDTVLLTKEPFGVVLVISPWNGPLITSLPLAAALAAGNTVILKPSELSVNFSATIARLVKKYFNEELFAVVEGAAPETTELLKERFDYICYTGCPPVAKIVMAAAAKHLTPVTLELGGKAPILVDSDADIFEAALKTVQGKLLVAGQACIGPDYFLVTPEVKPKLIEALKTVFETLGDIKQIALFERIINDRHFDRLTNLISKTRGKLVATSKKGPIDKTERFIPIHVFDIEQGDILLDDEIFGPILPILTVSTFEDALNYVKTHEKPLAAYIFTKDANKARRFIVETSSGGVTVNDVMQHGFAQGLPFGGVGNSGMGRLQGKYTFDTFTHEKPVLVRNSLRVDVAL